MKCAVCHTDIKPEEVSQYAAYGGLPSPCCNICFQVNDYSIKSMEELKAKSLLRRAENEPKDLKKQLEQIQLPQITVSVTWQDAVTNPPKETGRYWCNVEEITDLGKSYFQWNCSYNANDKTWSLNEPNRAFKITHWTDLLPRPKNL